MNNKPGCGCGSPARPHNYDEHFQPAASGALDGAMAAALNHFAEPTPGGDKAVALNAIHIALPGGETLKGL